ncbi:glycogen synthase GlgA [Aminiphilus circumscriptus]|uniref:glycogen synthase GlgA n=1 Tax=Aminiphilus circumscriptus TaxID=290732 RepID=UPI000492A97F|nr:glycogen synthase GlgA [Aminiphilus circumscriptus]
MKCPRVLHVASEMAPLVKLGGLGDVVGSLPAALREVGVDARIVLPAYPGLFERLEAQNLSCAPTGKSVHVALDWRVYSAPLWETSVNNTPVYLLEQPELFSDPEVYPRETTPLATLPFAFLSLAALEIPGALEWTPDIFHVHDWPGALVPAALKWHRHYRNRRGDYETVLTIHNLAHQWITTPNALNIWGFVKESFTIEGIEFYGGINALKGGILAADAITTVSPRYAWEIQTPQGGMGLDGVLASCRGKIQGILNGLDYTVWNPETDPLLPAPYSIEDLSGKTLCRKALLQACGWEENDRPLLVFVGRLVEQKGVDILLAAMEDLLSLGTRVLILGSGHPIYERVLQEESRRYQDLLHVHAGYDETLAHLLYAGGDMLLMPSLFEPCGLSQLIALRYGTVPLVRAVGGLADTIIDVDGSPDGNGFLFSDYTPHELRRVVERALSHWHDREQWKIIVRHGMEQDFSWKHSAETYKALYLRLLGN